MKNYFGFLGYAALAAFGILLLGLIFSPLLIASKHVDRAVKNFDAETSAQVYDNSRQYQQGTNRELARYCREWRAAEGPARRAVADLIRTTKDTYQGPLTAENQRCIQEIN